MDYALVRLALPRAPHPSVSLRQTTLKRLRNSEEEQRADAALDFRVTEKGPNLVRCTREVLAAAHGEHGCLSVLGCRHEAEYRPSGKIA